MLINDKINGFQFFVIVYMFTIGNTIINAPSIIISEAKQDAWIAGIVTLVLGLAVVLLYCWLASKFPDKTIIEYIELLLGKFVGRALSLALLGYFSVVTALMLFQIGTFVQTFILPETPRLAINLLFLTIVIFGTHLGIEAISRTGEIFFPITIILFLLLFIFLIPNIELDNLKPMADDGLKPILRGSLDLLGMPYFQLVAILMFIPFINDQKKIQQPFIIGATLAGFLLVCSTLYSLLVLGVLLSEYKEYSTYFLGEKISILNVIERVEVVWAFLWVTTIYFKTTLLFLATKQGVEQLFHLPKSKLLLFPLGLLLLLSTDFLTPNMVYINNYYREINLFFTFSFGMLLPLILALVYLVRQKLNREKRKELENNLG